jgi:hypothetical protein
VQKHANAKRLFSDLCLTQPLCKEYCDNVLLCVTYQFIFLDQRFGKFSSEIDTLLKFFFMRFEFHFHVLVEYLEFQVREVGLDDFRAFTTPTI